jgi:hypothetical protein
MLGDTEKRAACRPLTSGSILVRAALAGHWDWHGNIPPHWRGLALSKSLTWGTAVRDSARSFVVVGYFH